MNPLVDLTDRSILVTGGSEGIGAAIVRLAQSLGARVGVIDVVPPSIADAHAIADVSSATDVRRGVEQVVEVLGALDVLVNNAGVAPSGRFGDLSEVDWRRTLAVNVDGTFHCTQVCLPHLRGSSCAAIVNMGSIAGRSYSRTASAAYAASKGAVVALTRQLGFELAHDGVRVNCVCPGLVDTSIMTRNTTEQRLAELVSAIPLGRLASVDEVAASVCFLASSASAYLTGAVLDVTGGLT